MTERQITPYDCEVCGQPGPNYYHPVYEWPLCQAHRDARPHLVTITSTIEVPATSEEEAIQQVVTGRRTDCQIEVLARPVPDGTMERSVIDDLAAEFRRIADEMKGS